MNDERRFLLGVDAGVNLLLGLVLLAYPTGLPLVLGLPAASGFYPTLLGAVLVGIAVALWIERSSGRDGLGISGAIAINLLGAGVLVVWLVAGLDLPLRGEILLWCVATGVLGLSVLELRRVRRQR